MPAESNVLAVTKSDEKQFQRGFKTWCENTALSTRKKLGLKLSEPLTAEALAESLEVKILGLGNVPNLDTETFDYLSSAKGDEWSAVTVYVPDGKIIVVNPRHSDARKASNIMHELAHILRLHEPAKLFFGENGLVLRHFDDLQENEANWFAGCLLLPRDSLLQLNRQGLTGDEIIDLFGISKSLYNYRLNVSGVRRQLLNSTYKRY